MRNPKILVIEDEKALLKSWAEKFKDEGLTVYTANNSNNALQTAYKRRPDMIVIDLLMQGSEGLTFVKKLREDKWGTNVPVVFINSWCDPESFAKIEIRQQNFRRNFGLNDAIRSIANKLEIMKLRLV